MTDQSPLITVLDGIALPTKPMAVLKRGAKFETKSGRVVWEIRSLYRIGAGQAYIEAVSDAGTVRTFKPTQVAVLVLEARS